MSTPDPGAAPSRTARQSWEVSDFVLGWLIGLAALAGLSIVMGVVVWAGAPGSRFLESVGAILLLGMIFGGLIYAFAGVPVALLLAWLLRRVRSTATHILAFGVAGLLVGGAAGGLLFVGSPMWVAIFGAFGAVVSTAARLGAELVRARRLRDAGRRGAGIR